VLAVAEHSPRYSAAAGPSIVFAAVAVVTVLDPTTSSAVCSVESYLIQGWSTSLDPLIHQVNLDQRN
jgi:hypothetical protein